MRTSYLPKKLVVLYSVFLLGSSLILGCTSTTVAPAFDHRHPPSTASFVININTAEPIDLEKLPRIGPVLAARIIEHRKHYGPFRKAEHLLIIDGISEQRFEELRQFIK